MAEIGATKPYALAEGEGRTYEWHEVEFTIKAAAAETGGALSVWEVTTRPGEEPLVHTHEEDEMFYVLSGSLTFDCGGQCFKVNENGFVFLPRGVPHSYWIEGEEVKPARIQHSVGIRRPDRADGQAGPPMKLPSFTS